MPRLVCGTWWPMAWSMSMAYEANDAELLFSTVAPSFLPILPP